MELSKSKLRMLATAENSDYAVPAGQASLHPNWALSRFLHTQKYVPIGFADRLTSHSRKRCAS